MMTKLTPNRHIRMISEGSCYTKDWSNKAEGIHTARNYSYCMNFITGFRPNNRTYTTQKSSSQFILRSSLFCVKNQSFPVVYHWSGHKCVSVGNK